MTNYIVQRHNRVAFTALIALLFGFSSLVMAQEKQAVNRLESIAKKVGSPGMQVVHHVKGKQYVYTYGVKTTGSSNIIDAHTRFQAASLTKVVATYTFFKLYDQGLIDLDRPLYSYYAYPRIAENAEAQQITARMVLTHHTGLLNWEGDVGTKAWRESPLHTQFTPGTAYMYSGEGFYFLQKTLEHITQQTFQQLVEELVLKPLGMEDSEIVWKDTLLENIAVGHYNFDEPRNIGKYYPANAAYSLYTTASDYDRFIQQALLQGKGLKGKTHKLMLSPAAAVSHGPETVAIDSLVPLALGMRLQLNEAGTSIWHTGSNPGFRCFFIANIKTKESLVGFSNTDTGMDAMKYLMQEFLSAGQTFWSYEWRQGELD